MLRFAIIVTLLCVLLVLPTTPQDFSLILISTTGQDVNVLILECRNKETDQGEPSAFFWLNGTSLFDIMPSFQINRVSSGTQILFVITGDLEGVYTCGTQTNPSNRRESDSHYFLAFPSVRDVSNVQTVFPVGSGTEARLKCAIVPGKLIYFYSVEWSNASSPNEILISFRGGHTSGDSNNDRYSIDTADLSLIISDVSPSDAGDYVCVLGVDGGNRASGEMIYEQTRSVNLTLRVFDLPGIPHPPTPEVIILQSNDIRNSSEKSATFTCTATASQQFASSLEIFWGHDGKRDVPNIDPDKYNVEEISRTTSSGVTSVTTELTVNFVGVIDNGIVQCEARIPPSEASGSVPATTFASTTLTVLGGFSRMSVSITTNGNILFDITLPDVIQIDFNLFIEYMPLNGPMGIISSTTDQGYSNTASLLYLENNPPSEILNTGFTLRVALTTLNLETGPRSNLSSTLDTRSRPLGEEKITEILIAVSVVFGVILIFTFVVVILMVVLCRDYKKKKDIRNIASGLAKDVQEHEMKYQSGELSPVEVLANSYVKLYSRIRAECDSAAVVNDGSIQRSREPLTAEEIEQTMDILKNILEPALHNNQLKLQVFTLLQNILYQLTNNPDQPEHVPQFLIKAFKTVYCSVYDDVNQDEQIARAEDQAMLANFVEETFNCLIRKGYKFRSTAPNPSFIHLYK